MFLIAIWFRPVNFNKMSKSSNVGGMQQQLLGYTQFRKPAAVPRDATCIPDYSQIVVYYNRRVLDTGSSIIPETSKLEEYWNHNKRTPRRNVIRGFIYAVFVMQDKILSTPFKLFFAISSATK